jgi:Fe2+ transport system protein B
MALSPTEQPDPITLGQAMNVFIFVFKMYFLILFYFLVLGPVSSRTQQFLDFLIVRPKGYWVIFLTTSKAILVLVGLPDPTHLILFIPFIFILHLKKKLLSTCCGARTNMLVLIIM